MYIIRAGSDWGVPVPGGDEQEERLEAVVIEHYVRDRRELTVGRRPGFGNLPDSDSKLYDTTWNFRCGP